MITRVEVNNPASKVWRVIKRGRVAAEMTIVDIEGDGDVRSIDDFDVVDLSTMAKLDEKETTKAVANEGDTTAVDSATTASGGEQATAAAASVQATQDRDADVPKDAHGNPARFPPSDPRHGLTPTQRCDAVKDEDPDFVQWCRDNAASIRTGDHISATEQRYLTKLLYIHRVLLSVRDKCPRLIKGVELIITLKEGAKTQPKKERIYRMNPDKLAYEKQETGTLLKAGLVEPSISPWSSNIVMVKKKSNPDGSSNGFRMCVNYSTTLNPEVRADAYPVPRIDETLDSLGGAAVFSAVDAMAGYHGVGVQAESKPMTAFSSPTYGLLQWCRMPMGMLNSTAVFERMIEIVVGPELLRKTVVAFIDDLVCFSRVRSSHIDDLGNMLEKLELAEMSLKLVKCLWFTTHMPFLGHEVIAGEGVTTDKSTCRAMFALRPPSTSGDLASFLGAAVFYAKFIPDFAAVASPLRQLARTYKSKMTPLQGNGRWTKVHQKAFDALKAALCFAPVLAFPKFDRPWVLLTDASYGQISAILCQVSEILMTGWSGRCSTHHGASQTQRRGMGSQTRKR